MLRFVLLYHDCPPTYERASHWDFMLESGDVLRTWALEKLPSDWAAAHTRTIEVCSNCPPLAATNMVDALRLGDHRREYLELEGPLSSDRGAVFCVAAGTYRSEREEPGEWRVMLACPELSARVVLSQGGADNAKWALRTEHGAPFY